MNREKTVRLKNLVRYHRKRILGTITKNGDRPSGGTSPQESSTFTSGQRLYTQRREDLRKNLIIGL